MEERLKGVFSEVFEVPVTRITDELSNRSLDEWDSLGHLRLVSALEEEFGVQLAMAEILEMTSYTRVRTVLGSHLQK